METKTRSPNEIKALAAIISGRNTLSHFGVLGMRWGVRKDRKKSATSNMVKTSKPTNIMSNKELQDAIQRLEMEKKYAELTKAKQTFGQRMTKEALGILGGSTKKAITKAVDTGAEKAVNAALKAIEKSLKED